MDPWLEDDETFPDLHEKLLVYLGDALNAVLPPGYLARNRSRVWVDVEQRREPDVSVFGRPSDPVGPGGGVAALPGLVVVEDLPARAPEEQPYLEILSPKGKRLVTAVEVLSPANKRAGRKAYRVKQKEYCLGGVNLVEIDLLRAGRHTTAVSPDRLRQTAGPFDYHVSVTLPHGQVKHFAAAIRLSDRLPAFGIPLDPGVAPVVVDLQPLLDRAYDTGRYAQGVDYRRELEPPLTPEQRAWAEAVLTGKGILPARGPS
jgi:hypothetical protein